MKILFITSGYKGIYDYFEKWIVDSLKKKHDLKIFPFENRLHNLQLLTKSFNPEVAITLVGFKFPIKMVEWLNKQQVKTAVWFTEDPYYMDRTMTLSPYYDFLFTIDSAALEYYKNNGHKHAYQLPLAAEPEVFRPRQTQGKYNSDICILGYPYPNRTNYIRFLLQNTNYKIKVVGRWKNTLNQFRNHSNLDIHEGWVEPSIAADFYNGANIVLNTHRPFNLRENQNRLGIVGKSINNRTFDAAACGSFQLIEFKEDLPEHFIENEELVCFRSYQELLQKLDYYMQSKEERERIANNARERVLGEHTFKHRLDKMLAIINDSIKSDC